MGGAGGAERWLVYVHVGAFQGAGYVSRCIAGVVGAHREVV